MVARRKTRLTSGRGAIVVISGLLISSAMMRLLSGSGAAIAQAVGPEGSPPAAVMEMAEDETPIEAKEKSTLPSREEMTSLLSALRAREARVREMEAQIEVRRKALAVADEEITKRLEVLEQTEENLRQTLALADGAAEDDLARLTAVYENMKPKDAAALFAAMEPDFAAGFLGRMRPDAAAAVMAGLPPDVAYSISVILAGRNANAPKS